MAERRLLVIGFDSMDVELVRRWASAGYLPTFRRLFESSAWTQYVHPPEITSGSVFPSLHTGLRPLRHDGQEYLRLREGSYRLRHGSAADIKGDPFWAWFVQAGRRIVLADVPFTIPKPEYGGKQFLGWMVHDSWPWKTTSVPSGLLSGLSAQFGAHPVPHCYNYSTKSESLLRFRSGLLTGIERRTAILKSLITGSEWDLFYGVFSEAHCAGHLMWHLEDETHPRHNREQLAQVGHALRDVYAAIDKALGELLACAGTDTIGVVFFSQGMGPNYHGLHLFQEVVDRFNRRWGGETPPTDGATGQTRGAGLDALWKASVQKVPDLWRKRVRERLPLSLRAWLYMRRLDHSRQWSRMLAFPLPNDGFSVLRVNLAGRDPKGRVRAGAEYTRLLDAFTAELSQLTNVDTGRPAVERIFRADQQVDPMTMGSFPDLFVWWSKSNPIRGVRSSTLGVISGDFTEVRTGEHVMQGMFLLSHPRAGGGQRTIPDMHVVDIPVTLCELAGIHPGTPLDGTSRCRDFLTE
jgi:predicted AlkP superfamily phosphohydrolase/phosphomutase